jgi:DNA recombination-dependent growth factor C
VLEGLKLQGWHLITAQSQVCFILFVLSNANITINLASSVDAERAFSVGHRQVNFLQQNMTSQSFKARMAVGSWINSPACPSLSDLEKILEEEIKGKKDKGKDRTQIGSGSGEEFENMPSDEEENDN